ncbi:hypothetical protein BH09ACT6_BH09ACT6_18350 [soil metagenome]
MSVRHSILAVLTLGPAYGLQLHDEVEVRTARTGEVNVGQIYSTLGRLKAVSLVTCRSTTADGLPLYELTPDGRAEAARWLSTPEPPSASGWSEMVQHVLLALSLPGNDSRELISAYRERWSSVAAQAAGTVEGAPLQLQHAKRRADEALSQAALEWLACLAEGGPSHVVDRQSERPRRGRRPSGTFEEAPGTGQL